MRKFFAVLGTFVILGTFVCSVAPVISSAQEIQTENRVANEEDFLAVVSGNITRFIDSQGNAQIKIIDVENLAAELMAVDAPISATELQLAINKLNDYIRTDNALIMETKSNVLRALPSPYLRISCSDVMGAIGLIHSGAYAAAAYLLGITGPAAVVVPLLISTVYYLGSLLC